MTFLAGDDAAYRELPQMPQDSRTPIDAALVQLDAQVDQVGKALMVLGDRLGPLMRTEATEQVEAAAPRVRHGSSGVVVRVDQLTERLQDWELRVLRYLRDLEV